jgi:hypothetical protein
MGYTSPNTVGGGASQAKTSTHHNLKTPNTIGQRHDVRNDASSRDASDRQLAASKAASVRDHEARGAALRGPQKKDETK